MDYSSVIGSKMSKVEGALKELENEISVATKYLLKLKENSAEVVRSLKCITTPSTYLEEFLSVNSFLLRSISFLTEFNCKFEILGITEKALSNSIFVNESEAGKSTIPDDWEELIECNSVDELKSSVSSEVLERDIIELQPKENISVNKKEKEESKSESKTEISKELPCKNKKANTSTGTVTASNAKKNTSVNKTNNSNVSSKKNNKKNSHKKVSKQTTNSAGEAPAEKINAKHIDEENNSGSQENSQRGSTDINNGKGKEVSSERSSIAADLCNASPTTILSSTILSPGSIPVAEVVPTKIIDKKLEDFEVAKHTKDLGDSLRGSQSMTEINDDESEEIRSADIIRKVGKNYDVVVEYVKSPSEFYVSIIDNETNLLVELEKKLKEIPTNKNMLRNSKDRLTKETLSKEIGGHCLVYSKCDEIWCRAKVTNWCLNYSDDLVNVFLIDYGESKCVTMYDIQAMPKYLKQYPACTVRCHLHDVFPTDMDKSSSRLLWSKECSEEMKSVIEESQTIRIRVASNDSFHPATSLPVTLWLVDQGNKCLNELLVNSKFAIDGSVLKGEKRTEIVDENTALNNWNPMKEDYESYKNCYELDVNDPSAIIYGYVGKDYDRICRHFAKTGYCYKGQGCRKEHKKLDHLGFTTDQEEVFQSAITNLRVPPPNSKVNIQVTCLLACNKFFCFMESQNSSPEEEDLHSLLQFMNKKENILHMKKLFIPPSAGQIVLACYSEDKAWYRARVLESQPENDQYNVLFVDYGNSETLHLSDIRAIEARYLHLPFQAIQCCIFGIEQNPEVPSAQIMDYMQKIIDNGHLSIEVISRLPGDNINLLVNVFDQNGVNIGKDLISKKYALFKEEIIINSASESIPG